MPIRMTYESRGPDYHVWRESRRPDSPRVRVWPARLRMTVLISPEEAQLCFHQHETTCL